MGKRKCIGLIYSYNEGWIGGTYYIQNIISALNSLDDIKKPFLKIYTTTKDEFDGLINKTAYPYAQNISYEVKFNLFERIINKFSRTLLKRNIIDKKARNGDFAFVFPYQGQYFFESVSEEKKVYWIPDFQEDYLPQFFSKEEITQRKNKQQITADKAKHIVFSSNDACNDFIRLYPESKAHTYVLPFAVKPSPQINKEKCNKIVTNYGITTPFLLIPNQLWAHKNHKTVIHAAEILIKNGLTIQFIFTGKDSDYRFPQYPQELYNKVKTLGLSEHIKFLGFIPKSDLEALTQGCIAIIQPSLFEGWSTVIEEAKCMNKFIFASNIPIHTEQLSSYPNKTFFEKESSDDLANELFHHFNKAPTIEKYNYEKDFINFGDAILKIV